MVSGARESSSSWTIAVDELVTWLRAQLDNDEREINRHPIDGMPQLYSDDEREGEGFFATGESNYPCDSMLTVNKRFALAEIEAKRRILDWLDRADDKATECDYFGVNPEEAVRLLAQPYAGRAGWREEWRVVS